MQPSRRTFRVTLALAGSQLVAAPVSSRRKGMGWDGAALPAASGSLPAGLAAGPASAAILSCDAASEEELQGRGRQALLSKFRSEAVQTERSTTQLWIAESV